jgi:hypothetical protein
MNPARIGLPTIADDEHIGLDDGINLVALFVGLGQTTWPGGLANGL